MTIYTSYFDPNRAFPEIEAEKVPLVCKGSAIPRHIAGKGLVVFAILKSWYLALCILYNSLVMGEKHDVFIVDQISASIPLLRMTGTKVGLRVFDTSVSPITYLSYMN